VNAFLGHLAGIALGQPAAGAARPSLPPRFAPADGAVPVPEIEEASAGQRPAPAPAAIEPSHGTRHISDRGTSSSVAARGEQPSLPRSEPVVGAVALTTPLPASVRPRVRTATVARQRGTGDEPPAGVVKAEIPAPPGSPAPRDSALVVPREPLPPAEASPPLSTPVRTAEADPVRAVPVHAPRRAATATAGDTMPLAPLSDGAVAARTQAHRPPAPVIHLTIDRIDVRAPAPSRAAPPARRAPAEPSLSLSDFLAAGSPRPRQ
jgi:hypothetical protein